jgi:hypothetical protein
MNSKIAAFVLALVLTVMVCAWMPIPNLPVLPSPTSEEETISANPLQAGTSRLLSTHENTSQAATRKYCDAWLELNADRMTRLISDFSLERTKLTRDSARAESYDVALIPAALPNTSGS